MKRILTLLLILTLASLYSRAWLDSYEYNPDNFKYGRDSDGTYSVRLKDEYQYSGSLNIPSSVTIIHKYWNDGWVTDKNRYRITCLTGNISYRQNLQVINIPTSVKSASWANIYGCPNLKEINGTSHLKEDIDAYDCPSLKRLEFPSATFISTHSDNLNLEYANYASATEMTCYYSFQNCSSLKYINAPNLKKISLNAFENCSSLQSVSFPRVETIAFNAFMDCPSLSKISLPKVKFINHSVFKDCVSLKTVSLPMLTSMDASAFSGCKNLISINLPKLEEVYGYSFMDGCENIQEISIGNPTPPKFHNYQKLKPYVSNATLIVPSKSIEAYKAHPMWGQFFIVGDMKMHLYRSASLDYESAEQKPQKRSIKGVTADGVAQLAITFAEKPLGENIKAELTIDGATTDEKRAGTLSELQEIEPDVWGYIYTAPSEFPKDKAESKYTVTLSVEADGNKQSQCDIEIYRPGVLLLHGLMSDANCWSDFEQKLVNSGCYEYSQILNCSYKGSNAESFEENTHKNKVVKNGITTLENRLLVQGVVSAKYDLVGHSMGGILSRLFVQEVDGGKETVHKIITVNTPHFGSNWADFFVHDEIYWQFIRQMYPLLYTLRFPESYKAFQDLDPKSAAIKKLSDGASKTKDIPVHAFCSYLEGEYEVTDSVCYYESHPFNEGEMIYICDPRFKEKFKTMKAFTDHVLGENVHDGIVAMSSQQGGLGGSAYTKKHSPYKGWRGELSDAHHENVHHWDKAEDALIDLLKEPESSSKFSKGGFGRLPNRVGKATPKAADNELQFTAPQIGSNGIDGNVKISVEMATDSIDRTEYAAVKMDLSDNIVANSAFTITDRESMIIASNKNKYRFKLPPHISGDLTFYAIGRTDDGKVITDSCTIALDRDIELAYMQFADRSDLLMTAGQTITPHAIGYWTSGDVTYVDYELVSSDEKILAVDGTSVTALTEGECKLSAHSANLSDTINVTVMPLPTATLPIIDTDSGLSISVQDNTLTITSDTDLPEGMTLKLYDMSGILYMNERVNEYIKGGEQREFKLPNATRRVYVLRVETHDRAVGYKLLH